MLVGTEAAAQAGCDRVIIPVSHSSEVLDVTLEGDGEKDSLVSRLKSITGSALKEGSEVATPKGGSEPTPQ